MVGAFDRWAVKCQVHIDDLSAVDRGGAGDLESSELRPCADGLDSPTTLLGDGDQGITCGGNVTSDAIGEEVQVVGLTTHEPLDDQGTATGQQEASRFGQIEERRGEVELEWAELPAVVVAHTESLRYRSINDVQAARNSGGTIRSSHTSTNRAPST